MRQRNVWMLVLSRALRFSPSWGDVPWFQAHERRSSMVSYLFKTPLRRKDSLPSRAFRSGCIPDKKHILSRKQTRIVMHTYEPVTRVTFLRARTNRGGVRGACVAHTRAEVRNFRPTYTRVIYYVARAEHMSHLHIAWYRKRSPRLPTVWAICEKFQQNVASAFVVKESRVSFLRFLLILFSPLVRFLFCHVLREDVSLRRRGRELRNLRKRPSALSRCVICANRRKTYSRPRFEWSVFMKENSSSLFPNSLTIYFLKRSIPETWIDES